MYSEDVRVRYIRLKYRPRSVSEDCLEVDVKTILWLAGILVLWYLNHIADLALRLITPSSERGRIDKNNWSEDPAFRWREALPALSRQAITNSTRRLLDIVARGVCQDGTRDNVEEMVRP